MLRTIMVGGVWIGFLLGYVRGQTIPCRFCGTQNMSHLFLDCPFPPQVEIRENPEFHDLMRLDKAHCRRCLLWLCFLVCFLVLMVPLRGMLIPLRLQLTL